MGVVAFNYAGWAAKFPEVAAVVTQPQAENYFTLACLYLNNTDESIVSDISERATLLDLLVAHISVLFSPALGGGPGSVGRVSNATEGSVSVSTEYPTTLSSQWCAQSSYGAMFWALTNRYRSFFYSPVTIPFQQLRPLT